MLTIHEAAELIRTRKLSPVELLEQCLARVDQLEEKVRAWVFVVRDQAREQAEELTKELERGEYRGRLHGIPIGVKDIIDVFDWPTACGSKLWANSTARQDATVVKRLRQAGAVIMGKTVTTAYASFDPPVTRNPWNLERTPGGSSSGSAAAVACGMCLGALATQTGGSITRPASYCGVCSIKPTYGLVCLDGCLRLAPSMDHMGVMANCVRDVGILLHAIGGGRIDAVRHRQKRNRRETDTDAPLLLQQLRGGYESIAENDYLQVFGELIHSKLRTVTRERTQPPAFCDVWRQHQTIMAVEAARYHGPRLRRHPNDYPPRIRGLIEEGLSKPATEYAAARQHREELQRQLVDYGGGTLLLPATTGPAPAAATTGNPAMNSPWSFTGFPAVSLPFGWTHDGLPLAIQLVGSPDADEDLLGTALACEELLQFERREIRL
jgi:aspartyl-tRNA(Asn)/glutamyl-tRNA(Gln) amidotransferase subunit A